MLVRNRVQRTSRRIMLIGFISVMLLIVLLTSISLFTLEKSISNFKAVVEKNEKHIHKLNKMHTAARERILSLHKMVAVDESFLRDEFWMRFNSYGTEFITNRNDLFNSEINDSIRLLLEKQDQYTQPLGRLQNHIAQLAIEDNLIEARHLLIGEANLLQKKMLDSFRKIDEIVRQDARNAFEETDKFNGYVERLVLLISALIILLSYIIIRVVFKHVSQSEEKLQEEKQRALTTLQSMADAVLLIDNQGKIEEVNEITEKLLSQKKHSLVGFFLNDVIDLYDETEPTKRIKLIPDEASMAQAYKSPGWFFLRNKQNENTAVEYSVSLIQIDNELKGMVVVIHDISSIQELTKKLTYEANHDSLTGLKNRRNFESRLIEVINEVKRYEDTESWLCYFDLDHFKSINDLAGHLAGDDLLRQIAEIILKAVRNTDYVARLGGDEFAAIIRYTDKKEALNIIERIRQTLDDMIFTWEEKEFAVTTSLGLVRIDKKYTKIDEVLQQADKACYYSKQHGRNQVHIIDE